MTSTQTANPEAELLVGGQALIEGVMMRSPGAYGIAVRRADGSLALQRGKVPSLARRYPVFKLPLLRGIGVLFQSLAIGIRALNFSAEQAIAAAEAADGTVPVDAATPAIPVPADRDRPAPDPSAPARPAPDRSGWAVAGSMAFGLGLGVLVFLLLPLWLTQLAERHLFGPLSGLGFNLLDGGLRALFFLAYLYGISRLRDIHRVFMYHGAEHKVVFTYERRLPLSVENARAQSRLHPRCGTSFLLFVLLVSILVFALIPKTAPFLVKFGGRLLLVPVIAGLSYEVLRLTARRRAAPLFAALVFPGLMLQKITTQEPTDDMLEVAIVALEEALREDGLLPEAPPGAARGAAAVPETAATAAGGGAAAREEAPVLVTLAASAGIAASAGSAAAAASAVSTASAGVAVSTASAGSGEIPA
ncbi:MAG TPA: DUF1385 domain-containing protein [Thermoanaerobaculia bacterium]|nr:DUF1385 domain-containing protein [Thermoanaerobaculia bacterium]